jgi:hypothetical protein
MHNLREECVWQAKVLGVILASSIIKLTLKCVSFKIISKYLGPPMCQDLGRLTDGQRNEVERVKRLLEAALQKLPWKRNCLNHAILAKLMLRQKNISSTLHLGVAPALNPKQMIAAHAWLTVGPDTVCGDNGKRYALMVCFN